MKSYTTRFLKSLAVFYMAFPATYLLSSALLFDIPAAQCLRMLLSPWYYFLSALAIASGYGLYEMKRWAWYVFLLTNVLVGYNNAVLASDFGESHYRVVAFILSIFILVGIMLRVSREVRVPYFLPRIRWWESNPRYRLSVPVAVTQIEESSLQGEILDLSMGGCFIKLRNDLLQDTQLGLQFTCFGQSVEVTGTVVWRTQSAVTHPKGVGIKFGAMSRAQRRVLKAIVHRLREISNLYRTSRYLMNQEEFFHKMEELQNERLDVPVAKEAKA